MNSMSNVIRRYARAPLLLSIACALTALCACSKKVDDAAQAPAVTASNVKLTPAQQKNIATRIVATSTFRKSIEANGIVDFDNDHATTVLAPFSGPVARLLVAPGDQVKKGDALAVVDSSDFAAAIGSYRKALTIARNTRRLADADKDLVEHEGVAGRESDQAQADAANAEADRYAALQTLLSLNVDAQAIADVEAGRAVTHILGVIRAPITGTVVDKLITPGQLLQTGTTACFTVADLSRVWVMTQIFGADLAAIKVGDAAEISTSNSADKLVGKVGNIAAAVSSDTRSVPVRVVVDNPATVLKKQMYVHVLIHARDDISGMLVPVSAILRDDENLPFVYVAQTDGSFARAAVTLGYRNGDQYDIVSGLRNGDRVVVDGGIFVQFMQSQ